MRQEVFEALEEIIVQEWPQRVRKGQMRAEDRIFYEGVGLDSVDAVTLFILIEARFKIKIDLEAVSISHFETVGTLAEFLAESVAHGAGPGAWENTLPAGILDEGQ